MTTLARRRLRTTNIWPGFVDALAALLMVVIFLLMVFVLAQVFLSETLSGRDRALLDLRNQVDELADLLSLERQASAGLRANLAQLSADLRASLVARDDLGGALRAMSERADQAERDAARLQAALTTAIEAGDADRAELEAQSRQVLSLAADIAALQALKQDLEQEILELGRRADTTAEALIAERELSESARAQVALLNRQMAALREQIVQLNAALEASEAEVHAQNVQIANLGERLNAALATRVQELARYRSEFFGRLRAVLGDHPDVRIVGDRFVFQSEVLFDTGSAAIGLEGRSQLERVAATLRELAAEIPEDLDWVLQINGHTDKVPIFTARYASNWDLSAARAISVVQLMIDQGIPPHRLAAAGFAEFDPLVEGDTPEALRRNRRIELKLTQG
ncbi:MAG: peptidoglycan -binding protein [Rhodospirillales bacterium]|nr:MAG: peptidoglycan -binding protein [Rhodospirillales bacterium]